MFMACGQQWHFNNHESVAVDEMMPMRYFGYSQNTNTITISDHSVNFTAARTGKTSRWIKLCQIKLCILSSRKIEQRILFNVSQICQQPKQDACLTLYANDVIVKMERYRATLFPLQKEVDELVLRESST